ncbi:chitinase [Aspergillus granulosus]|uniref:chitinase n=1 Tax=Aspergillus granulosus TaxID=176169 RepID=A0ABR4I1J1_9EURO
MLALTWLTAAAPLLLSTAPAIAGASPGYRSASLCPERCDVSGADTGNWFVYPNFKQIRKCKETMFYDFGLYDDVDDKGTTHRIQACSSYGLDFMDIPASSVRIASAQEVEVEFQLGWWKEGFGLASGGIGSLARQLREYVERGHGAVDRPFIIYGQSGQATIGLYIGKGLLNQGLGESALKLFEDNFNNLEVLAPSLAMQLCGPGYDNTHVFGIMATSNGTFAPIQNAIKTWANGTCLLFSGSTNFTGTAKFATPLLQANTTTNSTIRARHLITRADGECSTVQVDMGNGCPELAVKCGISPADFTKYNPGVDFCSNLKPKQHVCCSEGDLPDFAPKPNADGSCSTYQVQADDNCDNIAAEYSLEREDIEEFNKNTWGFGGCDPLFAETIICLSEGTPPFPAEIANAKCGPQVPGTTPPTDGSDIADLNPCPLNACCNIWGQCGITRDFCIDTNTGSPGTAKEGTYGCISNCGMDVVKGSGSGGIKIAYYEGYCMSRDCLFQDASQIDTSKYTHLHFGFGFLSDTWEVDVGDELSTYNFGEFKRLTGVKRILSFGRWDFSTGAATYQIFRNGVLPANRLTMATKIANFIKENDLDGVDIDWEYPGAPDLPDFDPGTEEEGPNYLAFLVVLKNLLPGKSVSIAAPSSYWYLKQFPISQISKVVDYIVYMTYDLHGQWDAHNSNSQEDCDTGNCLRSQVNLTETRQSLAMITKAGVPGEKVVVGVTSYGRSFKMADPSCWGPECQFTGDRLNSKAKKGTCTGTAGNSDILIYDNDEWVGYMSASTKKTRTSLYGAWGLGGTSDWASDLQTFHAVPPPLSTWTQFKAAIKTGENPKTDTSRNGNWTDFDCEDPLVVSFAYYTPSDRWTELGANAAWADVIRIWEDTDEPNGISFHDSVEMTTHFGADMDCGNLLSESCSRLECEKGADSATSGPAEEDQDWLLLLIDLLTLGALGTTAPYFNRLLRNKDWFVNKGSTAIEDAKDSAMTLMGQSTTIAKDMLPDPGKAGWDVKAQDAFSAYMGQVIAGWDNVTSIALTDLFDGSPESITALTDIISDGKLIPGKTTGDPPDGGDEEQVKKNAANELRTNMVKCITGYIIPALWRQSGSYTFIIDAGHRCDEPKDVSKWLDENTQKATGVCVGGNQYYLAYPDGDARECPCVHVTDSGPCQTICRDNTFSAPTGLEYITDGSNYYGITKDDLVIGSVRTWIKHKRENTAQPGDGDPTNDEVITDLTNLNVTAPGYMRIPVCSAERAFQSWKTQSNPNTTPNYPCDIPAGKDDCGESTFVDQTSDASPKIEDCRQIILNIQDDGSTDWTTQVVGKNQREIASHGTCHFGVEATKVDGNVNFVVGGQDVIDIINDAITQFGNKDGLIGAKGEMSCNGNVHDQAVLWGIY